jgi:DNA modification methylase
MAHTSSHEIHFTDSRELDFLEPESIALVVTSPPYPMIEMWDDCFALLNPDIRKALGDCNGRRAFELMHEELDKTWRHVHRVLVEGGIVCINIGDATRKLGKSFRLYANHSRVLSSCSELGFDILPLILWRKTTNAPNKFMGSGMLPPGAYVTLEHEYLLVMRKGDRRGFYSPEEKLNRRESAFFWEERNLWFSDVWDLKGTKQDLNREAVRRRSAAFPFELAYRLINMFSTRQDIVLDPFLGTGTTMHAAAASERNSIGVEIDGRFRSYLAELTPKVLATLNGYIDDRLQRHVRFIEEYRRKKGQPKYVNAHHGFPVVTSQETELKIRYIDKVEKLVGEIPEYRIVYADEPAAGHPDFAGSDEVPARDKQLKLTL